MYEPVEIKCFVPLRSIVFLGSYTKKNTAANFQVTYVLIIGTDKSLADIKNLIKQCPS